MWIEAHLLQNFSPSNLNRDDTGSPKDCEFGGYRRARLSSQCQKKAIRDAFRGRELLPAEHVAVRTSRAAAAIAERLTERGRAAEEAENVAATALRQLGFGLKEGRTDYLLFLGRDEIAAMADVCLEHWDRLAGRADEGQGRKPKKTQDGDALPKEVKTALLAALDGRRAADVALFGRMLADLPERGREGACQMAHALSTNAMDLEFDYFTAVDDLKGPEEDAGAGMIGTVEFTSACFYRYAGVDLRTLRQNLGGDDALAAATVRAFLVALATAIPTGKQHSFAAHNLPSLLLTVARSEAPRSLANAFVRPVSTRDGGGSDLVGNSIGALDGYWGRLEAMYGDGGLAAAACLIDEGYADRLDRLGGFQTATLDETIDRVVAAAGLPGRAA